MTFYMNGVAYGTTNEKIKYQKALMRFIHNAIQRQGADWIKTIYESYNTHEAYNVISKELSYFPFEELGLDRTYWMNRITIHNYMDSIGFQYATSNEKMDIN